jgi:uncharacterized membrane protein YeaQ/YmgE (transglycosylase-associated protein family)
MLNFLWWFFVGPFVGWIAGRFMRNSQNPWLDALAGLVGAFLLGTLCELAGFNVTYTPLDAALTGAAGALVVTLAFRIAMSQKKTGAAKSSGSRAGSYTSYKSRMGK